MKEQHFKKYESLLKRLAKNLSHISREIVFKELKLSDTYQKFDLDKPTFSSFSIKELKAIEEYNEQVILLEKAIIEENLKEKRDIFFAKRTGHKPKTQLTNNDLPQELIQSTIKTILIDAYLKEPTSKKGAEDMKKNINWPYFVTLALFLLSAMTLIYFNWATKAQVSIVFNVGDIIGGILIGAGAFIAGNAYAKRCSQEKKDNSDKTGERNFE